MHKAKITTCLVPSRPVPSAQGEEGVPSVPLFKESVFEAEEIPGPKLFRDVLTRQWSSLALGPNPNLLDRRLYNLAPELASLLQIPSIDPLIVVLWASLMWRDPPRRTFGWRTSA